MNNRDHNQRHGSPNRSVVPNSPVQSGRSFERPLSLHWTEYFILLGPPTLDWTRCTIRTEKRSGEPCLKGVPRVQEVVVRRAASSTFLTDIVETNESEPPGMMSHIPESFFSNYDSLIHESYNYESS